MPAPDDAPLLQSALRADALLMGNTVHLWADAHVFERMLYGWGLQQRSRHLQEMTVLARNRIVRQFQRYSNAFPWAWSPIDLEEFVTVLRAERQVTYSTVRSYQNAIRLFGDYILDSRYGWSEVCAERFGARPAQVCNEWNTVQHRSEFEGRPEHRSLTRVEVQQLLDHADEEVASCRRRGRKGWLAAFRDATVLKVIYAYGLRRREAAMLDVADLGPNPHAPTFGGFGALQVRYGKAVRGGPPRRRTVLTVFDWIPDVLKQYLDVARPQYGDTATPWLWPTERGARLSPAAIDLRFARWRGELGWATHIGPHALRHSYVTHLVEDGARALRVAAGCDAVLRRGRGGASRQIGAQHDTALSPDPPMSTRH